MVAFRQLCFKQTMTTMTTMIQLRLVAYGDVTKMAVTPFRSVISKNHMINANLMALSFIKPKL